MMLGNMVGRPSGGRRRGGGAMTAGVTGMVAGASSPGMTADATAWPMGPGTLLLAFLAVTALLCLALAAVTIAVMRRHPEWLVGERQLEEMRHAAESDIRRAQARDMRYGYPEGDVEMERSNPDV